MRPRREPATIGCPPSPPEGEGWRFGPFKLEGGVLSHRGETIRLAPKEMGVLSRLLAAEGRLVSVAALLDGVWGDEPVGTESLNRCISTLRTRLASLCDQTAIETLHRRGYRIALPVLRLAPARAARGTMIAATTSPRAFELLMQAREHVGRRTAGHIALAIRAVEEAIEMDPRYAAAWITLADARLTQAVRRYVAPRLAGALALRAAERALAIEPQAAGALAVRGWVRVVIEDLPEGLDDIETAVAGDPENWLIRFYRGWAVAALGRQREGALDLERALGLLPNSPGLVAPHAYLLFCSGEAGRALEVLRDATDALPYTDSVFAALATVAAWLGHHEEAIAAGETACRLSEGASFNAVALAYALARAGRRQEAARLVEGVAGRSDVRPPSSLLAPVLLELGNPDAARAALAEAEAEGCAFRGIARGDPRLAVPGLCPPLRREPGPAR